VKRFEEVKISLFGLIKALLYVLLIAVTYQEALKQMILHDWAREDYSHCYLIPIVVLYLIWEKRAALAAMPSTPSWKGLIPFIFGLFLYFLGELGGEFFTLYISLWFVIVGLIWLHLGWRKIKEIAFALFMILTMFPFPGFINNKILLNLKLISSQLGVKILQLCGMSAYREGNIIDLGFTQLQVVDACSGLRYVFPIMVLSLLLAYWFKAVLWKKAVLVLSSLPLAIVVNSLRIAATGILYSFWGSTVAEGFFHGFSGWLIFIFTLPVLLGEMWILKTRFKVGEEGETGNGKVETGNEKRETGNEKRGTGNGKRGTGNGKVGTKNLKRGTLLSPMFIVTLVILVLTFGVSRMVNFREKVPVKKSFGEFPLTIGEWTGTRQFLDQKVLDVLDLSEYIMVSYRNPQGREIDFYVAYNESQSKGKATHSPETCLPGSGWIFVQAGLTGIPTGDGKTIKINRAFMEKSGNRELVYFWFPQRGRILTSLYQVKFYNFWDAVIQHRTDGALVRVITPLYDNENMQDAELRLKGFTKEIVPVLGGFLPE